MAPERPERVKYITRHGTEATRKSTRTQHTFDDEYPNTPTSDLIEKQENLRDEVFRFAIEKNGLPPGNFLIDWNTLLSHAEKEHKGIIHDDDLLDADRKQIINQIKIWSHFAYQAEQASKIFTAMLAIFDYQIEPFGKRFPDSEECNWIVDLGLPEVHRWTRERTLNTYENLKTSRGLGDLPFIDNDRESFYEHAEKQYPHHLVEAHPSLDTEQDRESNLKKIQTWYALGQDISNDADWIVAIRKKLDKEIADEITKEDAEGPDLQGLKEDIYDRLDNGDKIYAPELSHVYSVPLDEVESITDQAAADFEMEKAEKRKTGLMNEYDDLSSEGWSIWDKHLKRFISWDGLFAAAQSNWIALKDSHDYSPADDSEESLKLQIAIWKNFNADLEYAVRAIKKEGAERGNIWLLNLLAIDVEPKPAVEQADTEPAHTASEILTEQDRIQLTGLKEVLERLHREGVKKNRVVDGKYTNTYETIEFERAFADPQESIRLAELYETTPEKVLALRDEILAESKPEPTQPSEPLQIEPVSDPEREKILLQDNTYTREHLLNCKQSISEFTELDGIPLVIKFAAEEFLKAIEACLLTKDAEGE